MRSRYTLTILAALLCCTYAKESVSAAPVCRLEAVQEPLNNALQHPIQAVVIPQMKKPLLDGVPAKDEWLSAEPVEGFRIPGTDRKSAPATKAWLGVDDKNLYLAVSCTLAPGTVPVVKAQQHDGAVFSDESIEFFLQPDSSAPRYYQLAFNAAGTSFDAVCRIGSGADASWNPKWQVKTAGSKDVWTAEAAISLAELGIKAQGVRAVRWNLCRNIIPGADRYASWSFLPMLSFHKTEYFSLGLCTFGTPRGKHFSADTVQCLDNNLLRVDRDSYSAVLPNPCKVLFRCDLPDTLMQRGVSLQARLIPVAAAGKAIPVSLGKFPLRSTGLTTLTIKDLGPGDYKLTLDISGKGFKLSRSVSLFVRAPNIEPQIKGQILIDDSNWQKNGKVAKATGIEHQLAPQLLLKTEFKQPVLSFDPTDDKTVTCLTDFQGKLYAGTCTDPAATDTGTVFTYDPETDLWEKAFQVNEQGLVKMKVYGDKLYIPGYDANDGGWDLGNIYIHDGKTWVEKRTVPGAIHIYDLVVYHDRIYVSADISDAPPAGMSVEEALRVGKAGIYGRVVSSGDGGQTWREEYRGRRAEQDTGYMTVYQDKIVLNAAGDLVVFDGKEWKELGLNPNNLFVFNYAEDGGSLIMGTPFGHCLYDGLKFQPSGLFKWGQIRDLDRFGADWVLVGYHLRGGNIGHGPGGAGYLALGREAEHFNFIAVVPSDILHRGTEADLLADPWWQRLTRIDPKEMCISCHTFKGRLYLGTHPQGRVLVLPVAGEGSLESAPCRIDRGDTCHLWWQAATPPGTEVQFQVKVARSLQELEKSDFTGPDGRKDGYFKAQGESFKVTSPAYVQYRAVLKTDNPAKTPYLKRVVLTQGD
ncbi:MAG: hypothetical protein PHT33_08305 [bacterium]|nr:hypothetical protein [bacterium]